NDCQRAISVTDKDMMERVIHTDVVRIITQRDLTGRRKPRSLKQSHRAVTSICNVDRVGRRYIADSLRLRQVGQRLNDPVLLEVNDGTTVVAQLRDKQPLATRINGKMIDSAADFSQRDLRLQHKRDGLGRPSEGLTQRDPGQKCSPHVRSHLHRPSAPYFTMTQVGCSNGKATTPISAVVPTSSGLLTFQRSIANSAPSMIRIVSQSPMAMRPRSTHAPRIVPIAAA